MCFLMAATALAQTMSAREADACLTVVRGRWTYILVMHSILSVRISFDDYC